MSPGRIGSHGDRRGGGESAGRAGGVLRSNGENLQAGLGSRWIGNLKGKRLRKVLNLKGPARPRHVAIESMIPVVSQLRSVITSQLDADYFGQHNYEAEVGTGFDPLFDSLTEETDTSKGESPALQVGQGDSDAAQSDIAIDPAPVEPHTRTNVAKQTKLLAIVFKGRTLERE
ncbi:hypothetical protein RUND412_007282 [Rhizina undulata]